MSLKPEQRQRWLAIIAGAAVGIFVFDRLLLGPYLRAWRERSEQIAVVDQLVARGEALLDRADTLEQRWELMKRRALRTDRPSAEDEVLRAAARWARESRVNFTSLTPQWRQQDETFELLECRAGISGDLGEIARFVYELERDSIAVRLEELQVTSDDDQGRKLTAALKFTGLRFLAGNQLAAITP